MTDYMGDMSDPGTLVINEEAVAFYLGGMTPHIWTPLQVHRQTARYRHPIWVFGNNPGHNGGILDGWSAVQAAKALGVPAGTAISLDMETNKADAADVAYVEAARSVIAEQGYFTSLYGSLSTITAYPAFGGGKWVADWTGQPHLTGITGEWACQFVAGGQMGNPEPWDISVIKDVATSHLWDIEAVAVDYGVLVQIPSGNTRAVKSLNGGRTWE